MSIALVVTAGFGNGTLLGTVKGVALRGYDIGEEVVTSDSIFSVIGLIDGTAQNVIGKISANYTNVFGEIVGEFSVIGIIDDDAIAVKGKIDSKGQNVKGLI